MGTPDSLVYQKIQTKKMSFMIPTKKPKGTPTKVSTPSFTEDHVRLRVPEIRQRVLYLNKLIKRTKSGSDKLDKLKTKIEILRKERVKIINNLPSSLKWIHRIHELNILGFEQALTDTSKTLLIENNIFSHAVQKLQCQSLTNKGKQCSRKGTSSCGNFCKMHDPASVQVRKIHSLK